MNNALILLALIFFVGCKDHRVSDKSIVKGHIAITDTAYHLSDDADMLNIDTAKSVVAWKGTKLMGTGKHEGTVRFENGGMTFSNGRLVGGYFVVDMTSIYNTDIPKSDPIPRKNLTNHLNKDFETSIFPTASFTITKLKEEGTAQSYSIIGDMNIKGISKSLKITLKESKSEKEYYVTFTFDRFLWKIGENGSWLEKKLVDAEVTLEIKIVLLER